MKIGLVTTSFPREPGDPAGSFVGAHVRWLRRAGHDVDVICAGEIGGQTRELAGTQVVRVASGLFYRGGAPETLSAGGARTAMAAAGFSLRQLAAVRRRLPDWDAVCAHWLTPSALAVATLLTSSVPGVRPRFRRRRREGQLPFLAIAHSGDVHLLSQWRLVETGARLLERSGARLAFSSGLLAQAFFSKSPRAAKALAPRSVVCPMGVETPNISVSRSGGSRNGSRGDECIRLLFLGRLVDIKGVDILLDAFAAVSQTAAVELTICGDGPLRGVLEAQAKALGLASRVRFVGEVRGAGRDHFLANSDLMIVPSRELPDGRTEGMPVVVLEAIAAGTPVIVTATGGMNELPESVPKVRPNSADELKAAIVAHLDRSGRATLIERQRPIAEAQAWERVGTVLWRHWMPDAHVRRLF